MSLISIHNLRKSFNERVILNGLDLQVNQGDRIALIGENGVGKSTLFKLILGQLEPDLDSGPITIAQSTIISHLDQQLDFSQLQQTALIDPELSKLEKDIASVENRLANCQDQTDQDQLLERHGRLTAKFEALDGYNIEAKLADILSGLGLPREAMTRPLQSLSGGERMRAALAQVLIREPDVLLLDEPTNHLDWAAIEWLQDYLRQFKGALVVISHDRSFLDEIANYTAKLAAGKLTLQKGNYSHFVRVEKDRKFNLDRQSQLLQQKIKRQNEITQTMLSHRKISSYHSSQKKADRLALELEELQQQQAQIETRLAFQVQSGGKKADPQRILLQVKDLSFCFPDSQIKLFDRVNFTIKGQDRVLLLGPNGCGKTSLLKALLGQTAYWQGDITFARNIQLAYLGQIVEFENEGLTCLEELRASDPSLTEGQARGLLARYGFPGEAVFKSIHVLSGGERSRLYLCCLLNRRPDLLILDEPTNHLDINSREILEDALLNYDGALLAVSHDLYFIKKLAGSILNFQSASLVAYPSFQSYLNRKPQVQAHPQATTASKTDSSRPRAEHVKSTDRSSSLWTDREVELYPQLGKFPERPSKRNEERQFEACIRDLVKQLEESFDKWQAEKTAYEASFADASDSQIYNDYNQLLKQIETGENTYLKLLSLLEND